ncbi:MAG: prenyltransferase/squalene oxidase repeat-containing protein [Ktedonobacterales bacterium]
MLESQRDDGGWPIDRDLETFDTDLTTFAFTAVGESVPNAERVRDWLLARQFDEVCFPTGAKPGGWAWAMPAGWPDADDSSYTLLALRALGVPPEHRAIQRGADWLEGMQNRDGSWSTFVRNSRMPFDHDCPYITGHVLCALHAAGRLTAKPRILERALAYLARAQRYDGSFASIWFREATAGTTSVLEALADLGLLDTAMAMKARAYLLRAQNDDGGWAGLRMQASTAEETAWAMMALSRCPPEERIRGAVERGAHWLVEKQRNDGTWAEWPLGLYYSAMWYSDSQYAVALPVQALARVRAAYVTL